MFFLLFYSGGGEADSLIEKEVLPNNNGSETRICGGGDESQTTAKGNCEREGEKGGLSLVIDGSLDRPKGKREGGRRRYTSIELRDHTLARLLPPTFSCDIFFTSPPEEGEGGVINNGPNSFPFDSISSFAPSLLLLDPLAFGYLSALPY